MLVNVLGSRRIEWGFKIRYSRENDRSSDRLNCIDSAIPVTCVTESLEAFFDPFDSIYFIVTRARARDTIVAYVAISVYGHIRSPFSGLPTSGSLRRT